MKLGFKIQSMVLLVRMTQFSLITHSYVIVNTFAGTPNHDNAANTQV